MISDFFTVASTCWNRPDVVEGMETNNPIADVRYFETGDVGIDLTL